VLVVFDSIPIFVNDASLEERVLVRLGVFSVPNVAGHFSVVGVVDLLNGVEHSGDDESVQFVPGLVLVVLHAVAVFIDDSPLQVDLLGGDVNGVGLGASLLLVLVLGVAVLLVGIVERDGLAGSAQKSRSEGGLHINYRVIN
jgi:hypothetical protein